MWKLDRMGRSLQHLTECEKELIRECTMAGLSSARARGRTGERTARADQASD